MQDMHGPHELSNWTSMNFGAVGGLIEPAGNSSGLWKVRCCTAPKNILPDAPPLCVGSCLCSSQVSWCDELLTEDAVIGWMASEFPGTNRIYLRKGQSVIIDLEAHATGEEEADAVGPDTGFYFVFEERKPAVDIDSEDELVFAR